MFSHTNWSDFWLAVSSLPRCLSFSLRATRLSFQSDVERACISGVCPCNLYSVVLLCFLVVFLWIFILVWSWQTDWVSECLTASDCLWVYTAETCEVTGRIISATSRQAIESSTLQPTRSANKTTDGLLQPSTVSTPRTQSTVRQCW